MSSSWPWLRESMLNPDEQRAKAQAAYDFLMEPGSYEALRTFREEHPGWSSGGGLIAHNRRRYVNTGGWI